MGLKPTMPQNEAGWRIEPPGSVPVAARHRCAAIAAAGYDTITPIVICNSSDFGTIRAETGKTVAAGDPVLHLAH